MQPSEPSSDPCGVLLVEDDEPLREAVRFILVDAGFEVFEALDGVVALDMLRLAERPLVVILDFMMPRMSGLEVLNEVAKDARLLDGHAFILTTAAGKLPSPLNALIEAHAIPVMAKPFDLDALLAIVTETCTNLRARRQHA